MGETEAIRQLRNLSTQEDMSHFPLMTGCLSSTSLSIPRSEVMVCEADRGHEIVFTSSHVMVLEAQRRYWPQTPALGLPVSRRTPGLSNQVLSYKTRGPKGTCPPRAHHTPTTLRCTLDLQDPGNSVKALLSLHQTVCFFLDLVSRGQVISPVCAPVGLIGGQEVIICVCVCRGLYGGIDRVLSTWVRMSTQVC